MRRALVAAAVLALPLTGCAGESEPTGSAEDPTTSATPSETAEESTMASPTPTEQSTQDGSDDDAIEIEIEGGKIEPNGRRVEVAAGGPIVLEVESDRRAELHVHSSPEQTIAIKPGESSHELTIDRPGVVDVEEHETGVVVLQLEVR